MSPRIDWLVTGAATLTGWANSAGHLVINHKICDIIIRTMTYQALKAERLRHGWTQETAAGRLGVSQPYLAMLEAGKRRLTSKLANRALAVYQSSPALVLPSDVRSYGDNAPQALAEDLAALGYPGFSYLRPQGWQAKNPAQVLLTALAHDELEPRLVEGLPWLVLRYAPFDDRWLVREAKLRDLQNRVGFVVTLARRLAERQGDHDKVRVLEVLEAQLERSRLAREDTLCKTVREPQRRWLVEHRPEDARHWNLLTDWTVDAVRYVA